MTSNDQLSNFPQIGREQSFKDVPEAALHYKRDRNWNVIKLKSRSKFPKGEGWPKQRFVESEISHIFSEDSNVGLLLGEPSGNLIDIDLDCPEAVAAGKHFLPRTGLIFGRTSNPYSHHLYKVAGELRSFKFTRPLNNRKKNSNIRKRPTVILEIRSTGCQTMAPPSIHPGGERSQWHAYKEALEIEAYELKRAVTLTACCALIAQYWPGEGSRHDFSLALSGILLKRGIEAEICEDLIVHAAEISEDDELEDRRRAVQDTAKAFEEQRNITGLPTLKNIIEPNKADLLTSLLGKWLKRISQVSKTKAQIKQSYRKFPIDSLPEPVHSFVKETSLSLGCDPSFVVLPLIAAIAAAIGNTRVIRLKNGWDEPSIIWTIIVGESGTLKSPAMDKALKATRDRQAKKLQEYSAAMEEYEEELTKYEADRNKYKQGKLEGDPPRKPKEPVAERYLVSDTTIESLAIVLNEAFRGVLLARDELGGWIGSFDQYKKGKADAAQWLELFRAGCLLIDRKTGKQKIISVSRASVSITGGIQPGLLRRIIGEEYIENGLAARFLMAMPPRRKKKWTDREVSSELLEKINVMFNRLFELTPKSSDEGELSPIPIELSSEAKELWIEFYNSISKEQIKLNSALAAAWAKLEGYAARIALIIHLIKGMEGPIDRDSIQSGIEIIKWFSYESRRVYSYLKSSEDEIEREKIIDLIERKGPLTPRELTLNMRGFKNDTIKAKIVLSKLVTEGILAIQEIPSKTKIGRPTTKYVLNTDESVYETNSQGSPPSDVTGEHKKTNNTKPPSNSNSFVDNDEEELTEWSR